MKRKKMMAFLLAAMLGLTSVLTAGCGGNTEDSTEETADTVYTDTTIYGEVTAVGDSSITIDVGIFAGADNDENADDTDTEAGSTADADGSDAGSGGMAGGQSMELTLTGESVTVEITDDTTITKMTMGGFGSMSGSDSMGGGAPSDAGGNASSDMGGDAPSDMGGDAPSDMGGDAPSGDAPSDAGGEMTIPENGTEMGEAPDLPDGTEMGDAPDLPDGTEMGDAPDMSGESAEGSTEMGEMDMTQSGETISLSDISVGDIVSVTYDSDGLVTAIVVISSDSDSDSGSDSANADGMPGSSGGSSSSGVDEYAAVVEYTEDTEVEGETFTSTGSDENAILVNGANVILNSITVDRTSSNSTGGDNSSFYGVGAALLAISGTMTIRDALITTDSAGGAGVFSYGDAVVYVSDSTITTQQDTSGGIHVAGGGTLYAWNLTVETNGGSAAAIRSDRGGGTMVVDGGTYTSNGTGSPAVYCTADIAINDATLTATNSEAVCIEGLNSLHIFDSDLTGSMQDSSQNDCTWNIILYQSMSGDSEVGNSVFEMQGGSITAKNGGMFYTTNTESTFILKDVDITYADDSEFFLKVTGNSNERGWGSTGSNGADCSFTAIEQEMEGAVIWDSISTLDFYMTDGSTLTGYVEDDESNAGSGGSGYCNVYIDSTSTWIVTGDSVLTALYCEGTIKDAGGNTVTIMGSDGTVYVQGTSSYTITVDTYETAADLSGASEAGSWSDYEAEEP